MSPVTRKMLWVSVGEAVTAVEKMIAAASNPNTRNALVARLAILDQHLAALRDKWDMPELPICEGRR